MAGDFTFKVEGADQLRALAVELKAADKALMLAMRRGLRAATKPAAAAVQAEERRVLPKRGGLNEYVASQKISVRITATGRSAGVTLRQAEKRIRGYIGEANETGAFRHPVFADPEKTRKEWTWVDQEGLPTGWWERPLLAMEPTVQRAMKAAMDEAARVAGFRGP